MGNRQIFMRNLHNKLRTEPVGLHRVSITPAIKTYHSLISCVKAGVIGLFPQRLTIYAPQSKLSQVTARQKSFNTECTEGAERRREQLEYVQRLLWEIRLGFSLCPLCSLRSLCYRFSVGVHRFPFPLRPLIENGCFSSIWEDAKPEVQVDRARQDDSFQIAAFADQIVDRITMTDPDDVLLNDRAVVQLLRDVVARGADELDAPVVRLVVRPRSNKRRQKRVVNVDDPVGKSARELRAQDLHVPSEHNQVDMIVCEQLKFFLLLLLLIFGPDRKHVERDTKALRHGLQVRMVADYERNASRQFSRYVPKQQIVQAVAVFRDKNGDALDGIGKVNSPLHLQPFGERCKSRGDFRARDLKSIQFPFHAHQEQSGLGINMIVGVNDVAAVLEEKFRDLGHQTLLVRATDQQYGSGLRRHSRFGCLRDVAYNIPAGSK